MIHTGQPNSWSKTARSAKYTLSRPPASTSRTLLVSESVVAFHLKRGSLSDDLTGFFIAFSELSGGIFIDMGIHDVRLPPPPTNSIADESID
jgi:hypothetical protein